eukprot:11955454-Alexandrium_andersonii.AAC.1
MHAWPWVGKLECACLFAKLGAAPRDQLRANARCACAHEDHGTPKRARELRLSTPKSHHAARGIRGGVFSSPKL